ncbi:MAG TPA: RecX family transcriptional regulator [Candidatus Omnitrophota bacterium]|mgnify:CR=1 FL=1|nr:RecX family transcriptional regulator [Candidatus Omnitrophota bacterium]HPS37693.1 RecX family transcriptional regulator [Candidatus Omnitrophota bacterium]
MDTSQEDEQYKQALITSLRLLAASPKSGGEIRKKLESKGYGKSSIDRALRELSAQGVLDDSVFAKDLVARLTGVNNAGRYKVAFELKRHGVPEKIRNELLETLSPEAELERALEQSRLKWAGWATLDPQKKKKRLYDFLIRKGYDFQIAQEVLQKLTRDPAGDDI